MTENSLLLLKEVTPLFKKPKSAKFARGVRIFIYYKQVERQHQRGTYDMDIFFKVMEPKQLDRLFATDTPVPASGFFFEAKQWGYSLHLGSERNGYNHELEISLTNKRGHIQYEIIAKVPPGSSHFVID